MIFSNHPAGMLEEEDGEWVDPKLPTIPEFYKGKDIFITGGSGFMGKVLIEKLVRSCPDIKRIFMLIRPKKGKNAEERLQTVLDLPLFAPMRNSHPKALEKIIPVAGDVTMLKLGLSDKDIRMMEGVTVIFHSAASVRFDDTLQHAVLLNTRGTREVVFFAERLRKLDVLVHVSTTYVNPDRHVIEEEIYPPYADWKKTIKICETLDESLLNTLTAKYTSFMPNTYTFSKSLSEQILLEYKEKLPIVLFRPSIVISAMKDPFPGWLDNFNGPVGLLVGCGIGITRTMYCSPDNIADFTPVDVCIKAMIASAWKRATIEDKGNVQVYNCCTSNQRNATMEQIIEMGRVLTNDVPLDKMLWAPGGRITPNRALNFIKVILFHILPAMVLDQIFKFGGQKPFLTKLQRKIYMANCALEYFILNNWHFKNHNFIALGREIRHEDIKDFNYRDFIEFDIMLYFRNCILGARRYLLHEKDEDLPRARTHYKRMKLLDRFVKSIMFITAFYYVFIKYDLIHHSKIYFENWAKS